VADGGGLENRYGGNLIVGSNPTPSARIRCVATETASTGAAGLSHYDSSDVDGCVTRPFGLLIRRLGGVVEGRIAESRLPDQGSAQSAWVGSRPLPLLSGCAVAFWTGSVRS
jgi:hypothetical protein